MRGASAGLGGVRLSRVSRARWRVPVVFAALASLLAPTSALADDGERWKPSDPRVWSPGPLPEIPPVRGGDAVLAGPATPVDKLPAWQPQAPVWPAAAEADLDLAAVTPTALTPGAASPAGAAGARTSGADGARDGRVPGTPLRITPVPATASDGARTAAPTPNTPATPATAGKVRVTVADRAATTRAGVDGLLFSVRPQDARVAGRVTVGLDYSAIRHAYGADWASRLRLVALPECALTTPERPECRAATPVPIQRNSVRDAAITAELDLAPTATAPNGVGAGTESGARAAGVGTATVLAAAAGPSGPTGDFKATSLQQSGAWSVSGNTGSFTWSHPVTVPPVVGGTTPNVQLSYNSASVDGRTASTNTQTSWAGDGWEYSPGFIERTFKPCAKDGQTNTGEQCWGPNQLTMSLNGSSTQLVSDDFDPNNPNDPRRTVESWRSENGSATRVELLRDTDHLPVHRGQNSDKEYWRVTTTDGTQYYFGRQTSPTGTPGSSNSRWTAPVYGNNPGEPCYNATFADASCTQVWRWNLDYVVDIRKNLVSYTYAPEENWYARGATGANPDGTRTKYVRGGTLTKVTYGSKTTDTGPTAQVAFTTTERCWPKQGSGFNCNGAVLSAATAMHWPDVPFDQNCAQTGECKNYSPTFWSTKKLSTITTGRLNGATATTLDEWTLTHEFADPQDGSSPSLWLKDITHRAFGTGGTPTAPQTVDFTSGDALNNRVDAAGDGAPEMKRRRITGITTESGMHVAVSYAGNCTPGALPAEDRNGKRCYPVYWNYDPVGQQTKHWFHKYVVTEVTTRDGSRSGATDRTTSYQYVGDAAWHRDESELTDPTQRTWNEFRGYGEVIVRTGPPGTPLSQVSTLYMRGMDGDRDTTGAPKQPAATVTDSRGGTLTDKPAYAGYVREVRTYNGDPWALTVSTLNTPADLPATATHNRGGNLQPQLAQMVPTAATSTKTLRDNGGWLTTGTTTTYEANRALPTFGMPLTVSATGDDVPEQCTRTSYASNDNPAAGIYLLNLVTQTETVVGNCTVTAGPGNTVGNTRTLYDGKPHGQVGEYGAATTTQVRQAYGTSADYLDTTRTTYDAYGRVTSVKDALDQETRTAYEPADTVLPTKVTTTNPKGWTSTVDYAGPRNLPVTTTDPNGRVTTSEYDAYGRLTKVWLPGRTTLQQPNMRFTYALNKTTPSVVTTETLRDSETYHVSHQLLDSYLNVRQVQASAPDGLPGRRLITDTFYDSVGRVATAVAPYYNEQGNPSPVLFAVAEGFAPPSSTDTVYDRMGRTTAQVFKAKNVPQWSTTTEYPSAERTKVTPPAGGTTTTTIVDARGKPKELRQHRPDGGWDTTTYAHDPRGQLERVTDPAGNTWTYTYDLLGRQIRTSDPDRGVTETTYDPLGRVATTKDARGQVLLNTYDELSRKTALHKDSISDANLLSTWEFDPAGAKGQPAGSTRYTGGKNGDRYQTQITGYDVAYRPLGTSVTIPPSQGALTGTYSTATEYKPISGRPTTTSLSTAGDLPAEVIDFAHNPDTGLLDQFGSRTFGINYLLDVTYDHYGRPTRTTHGAFPKQVAFDTKYDVSTGRVTGTEFHRQTGTGDTAVTGPVDATDFTYNPVGDITSIKNLRDGAVTDLQCFTYDYLRRMTEAWTDTGGTTTQPEPSVAAIGGCNTTTPTPGNVGGPSPYWQSYEFDATGNRTKLTEHGIPGAGAGALESVTRSNIRPQTPQGGPVGGPTHNLAGTTTSGSGTSTSTRYGYDAAGNTTTRELGPDRPALEASAHTLEAETLPLGPNWTIQAQCCGNTFSGGRQILAYPAQGQTRTVKFTAPADGTYRLSSRMSTGTDFAKVDARVDTGPALRVFDGYADAFRNTDVAWGTVTLTKGEHTLTFTSLAKNPQSTNYALGMDQLRVVPVGAGEQTLEAETLNPTGTAPRVVQNDCCGNTFSAGKQLLATANAVDQTLTLDFTVPTAAEYTLSSVMSEGTDFGNVKASVNGTPLPGTQNGYATAFRNKEVTWGSIHLTPGTTHKLTLTVTGRQAASTNYVFGMDQLRITPAPTGTANAETAPRGGTAPTRVQNCCGPTWNGAAQLLVETDAPDSVGKTITLGFTVPTTGDYTLDAVMTRAWDFGIVEAKVDTTTLPTRFDGYQPTGFSTAHTTYGTTHLTAGAHTLTLTVVGKHPAAGKYRFGIDTFRALPATHTRQDLTWDPEGRLASNTVTTPGTAPATHTYLYDADGTRLIRRDATATTLYLGDTELTLPHNSPGATPTGTRYYKTPSGLTIIRTQITKLTYQAADPHGTATTTVDATTMAVTRRDTKPYGTPRGTPPAPTTWPDDKGFLGKPQDTTGLTHIGAREYDPTLGRFITVDPIMDLADPQQMHGYAYANNGPASFSDPSGAKCLHGSPGGGKDGICAGSPSDTDGVIGDFSSNCQSSVCQQAAQEMTTWAKNAGRYGLTPKQFTAINKYRCGGPCPEPENFYTRNGYKTPTFQIPGMPPRPSSSDLDKLSAALGLLVPNLSKCHAIDVKCASELLKALPPGKAFKIVKGTLIIVDSVTGRPTGGGSAAGSDDDDDFVSLFKAPQPGKGESQFLFGYQPADFPGTPGGMPDGSAYFAKGDKSLADKYAESYKEGVIEIRIPSRDYTQYFQQYEHLYEGGPRIEVAIPNTDFSKLNEYERLWHR